jgi:hypothetical protein
MVVRLFRHLEAQMHALKWAPRKIFSLKSCKTGKQGISFKKMAGSFTDTPPEKINNIPMHLTKIRFAADVLCSSLLS